MSQPQSTGAFARGTMRAEGAVHLDHAAATPLRPEVVEAVERARDASWANPSSQHAAGRAAAALLDAARRGLAEALRCEPGDLVFTRGGTEAANLAVLGRAVLARREGREPTLVRSAVEHSAVREAVAAAVARGGREIVLDVGRDGRVDEEALAAALAVRPDLVATVLVESEVGLVLPVERFGARTAEAGVPLLVDAAQALRTRPVDLAAAPIDLLTVSGQKLGAPRSAAALFVRRDTALAPVLHGGGQERGLRPGTEDVAAAIALATAVELAVAERETEVRRLGTLRDRFERRLLERLPAARVLGWGAERSPHVTSVGLPRERLGGADGGLLVQALDLEGVAASVGSACRSRAAAKAPGPAVAALLGDEAPGWATVRFSYGRDTVDADLERALVALERVVGRMAARANTKGAGAET